MSADDNFTDFKVNDTQRVTRLTVLLAYAGTILWLSLAPSPPKMPGALGWDKLQHAIAYGVLAVLVARFLDCLSFSYKKVWWRAGLITVFYGGLLELLQLLVHTGRTAEWWDLVADAVGVLFAGLIFLVTRGRVRCQEKSQSSMHIS